MNSNEMTWRKMPRNIMTDPNMDYISSCLPHQYAAAPYIFYTVALSIADDDGIFDLEDGIIFSRLMHMGDAQLVMNVANLMLKRKIISRAGTSTKCMLTNWEYSIREKPRTIEDRRRIVQQQIEAERAVKSQSFTELPLASDDDAGEVFTVDFSSTPSPAADFSCAVNDTSSENVVTPLFDDKNAENVVKNEDTEKIREDKNREIEGKPLRADYEALRDLPEGNTDGTDTEQWDGTETKGSYDMAELAQQALDTGQDYEVSERQKRAYSVLNSFFAKNCLGYDEMDPKTRSKVLELARRVAKLETQQNPVEIIASTLVGQFKKLTEEAGYYKNHPLYPENLLEKGFYSTALAATSKILLTGNTQNGEWITQLQYYQAEIDAEKANVGDAFDDQYLKYGIDPKDPNRAVKLMQAQRKGTKLNE